jgi:hypothetical protein
MGYSADPVTKAVMDNILGKLPTKKNQVRTIVLRHSTA